MNFVKLFSESDLFRLEQHSSQKEIEEILKGKGIKNNTISSLLIQVYQQCTIQSYSLEQKQKIVNLTINILKLIPHTNTKESLLQQINHHIESLGNRDQNLTMFFTLTELSHIRQKIINAIVPYYQLYQICLDDHPYFQLQTKKSNLVQVTHELPMSSGNNIEVDNIQVLQQFIGIRAPKEQKKDGKKK